MKWIHSGQVKSAGFKTAYVTFSKISKEDSGTFTCRANNSAGITEKQIYVIVKCEYILYLKSAFISIKFIEKETNK